MAVDLDKPNASATSLLSPGLMSMGAALVAATLPMALFYYPLAFLYAMGLPVAFCFDVTFPATCVLSVLSLPMLAATASDWSRQRWIFWATTVYCACVATSTILNGGEISQVVIAAGRFTIPVALAAVISRFSGTIWMRDLITSGLCLIWLLSVVSCVMLGRIAGVCANQNWVAATTIATAPFAYTAFAKLAAICQNKFWISSNTPGDQQRPLSKMGRTVPFAAVVVCIVVLTGLVVKRTECRASLVAVGGYVLVRILEIESLRIKRIVLAFLCCFGILGVLTLGSELGRLSSDIRLPIWQSTLAMIADKPFFGHGPGQFGTHFMEYRSTAVARQLIDGTANHPHNEPLLVAADLGIPAAICWLTLCCIAMWRVPGRRNDEAPRMAAITLFGHGLLDLPLAVSPSSIIFVVVMARLISERLKPQLAKSPVTIKSSWTRGCLLAGTVLLKCGSLCAIAFAGWEIYNELSSGWAFRRGIELSYAAVKAPDPATANSFRESAYASYQRACQYGTNKLRERVYVGVTANEDLGRASEGRQHFQQILQVDPQFAFTNYLMARCDLRDAFDASLDESSRRASAERAAHFLIREIRVHPLTTRVHEQLIVALAQAGKYAQVRDAESTLTEVYQERFHLSCKEKRLSEESLAQLWLTGDPEKLAEQLNFADSLTNQEVYTPVDCFSVSRRVPALERVRKFVSNVAFQPADATFWRDILELNVEFSGVSSPEELFTQLVEVQVEERPSEKFSWPSEVWRRRKGTPFEAACLVAALSQQFEKPCVLVKTNGDTTAVMEWNGSVFCCRTKHWEWKRIEGSDWKRSTPQDRLRELGCSTAELHDAMVFVYPHAFRHRNRALFAILKLHSKDNLPDNPHATVAKAVLAFPEIPALEFATEPFERLENDLSQ